jgi:predicted N-acetyltransferase YhbS
MTVKIRVMEEADIDQADRVLRLAFGRVSGFMPQIHLQRAVEPESLWVAEDQGRIVGTVSTVVFPQLAYVGLMSVDPEFQGRGIGRMLMGCALEAIDRQGCAVTLLDATDKGAPLYESLGFIDDSTAYVFERETSPGDSRTAEGVEAASKHELPAIIALDAPIFGSDRSKLLRAVWHEGAG